MFFVGLLLGVVLPAGVMVIVAVLVGELSAWLLAKQEGKLRYRVAGVVVGYLAASALVPGPPLQTILMLVGLGCGLLLGWRFLKMEWRYGWLIGLAVGGAVGVLLATLGGGFPIPLSGLALAQVGVLGIETPKLKH